MDGSIVATSASETFVGQVGDDLVHVHVGGRACAGLKNVHGRRVRDLARDDAVRGPLDGASPRPGRRPRWALTRAAAFFTRA
jgi:hypothetical protein